MAVERGLTASTLSAEAENEPTSHRMSRDDDWASLSLLEKPEIFSGSYRWLDTKNLSNPFTLVGRHTYAIGQESGKYDGRWNGVWSLPIKLADSVHFAIKVGSRTYWLYDNAVDFVTKLSHVERHFRLEGTNDTVTELMFIPEDRKSVCWRFLVKLDRASETDDVRFLASCHFNLMWEVKQAGELYKTKKEILAFNENNDSVVARHYRHADWIGIFGANRSPSKKYLGTEQINRTESSDESSPIGVPTFGYASLEYIVKAENSDGGGRLFEIDFCLTGGSLTYVEALREYNDSLTNLEILVLDKAATYQNYLGHTVELTHFDELLSRSFQWSKVNLHMLEHYQEGFGTGFFAGLPHFAIYFGRDMSWSSFGALAIGDFNGAMESLNLLARFQAPANGEDMMREPYYRGEIPHEIRTEGTVYYYTADATPLFVIACKKYLDWTKDTSFIKFLYNNIVSAIDWSIDADRDGDGFIEHGPEGFLIDTTWMDSYYRGKSALDVQAIYCKALFDGSKIASYLGDDSHAGEWLGRANRVRNLLVEKFWDKRNKFFFDTIEPDGKPNRALSINSIVPLLLGLVDENRANDVLTKIESSDFMTDWGVRTRAKSDPEYDPRSYQKGGVWPFCTGWLARADFSNGRYAEGLANIRRFISGLGMGSNYFKEVLYGDMPPAGAHPVQPTGCFIQAWSASMFLSSIVEGLLGVSPLDDKVPNLRIVPYLQEGWNNIEIRNIRVGENAFHYKATQEDGKVRMKIVNDGPEVAVVQSGFVMSTTANIAKITQGKEYAERFSHTKSSEYLRASFEARLVEGDSREFSFVLSQ